MSTGSGHAWPRSGKAPPWAYLTVCYISFLAVCLELFYTRILGLKTFSHVVYIIISFALLGYGIGANLYLLAEHRIRNRSGLAVGGFGLAAASLLCVLSAVAIARLPIRLQWVVFSEASLEQVLALLVAYTLVTVPFVTVGFVLAYFFSSAPAESPRLYFWDLAGAAGGAFAFFLLINRTQVFHSLFWLSLMAALAGAFLLSRDREIPRWAAVGALAMAAVFVWFLRGPEPNEYAVDPSKSWENIAGHFKPEEYAFVDRRWNPLGRTDVHRIVSAETRSRLYSSQKGPLEINLVPTPEFAYFATNFQAGTPVFNLAAEPRAGSASVALFSEAMEFPYLLLEKPRVMVIGAGGGRDVIMARTHGASDVLGAEINPYVHRQMSKGGGLFEYSGGVYEWPGVRILKTDGRHLVRLQPEGGFDLVVLNGVDTFAGLSSGAYVFAESYLYTKEAVLDYLRVIKPGGFVNLNRWFYVGLPRESLRLFAIVLDALRTAGAREPWRHVVVGEHREWGMLLVKKTPFTQAEEKTLSDYFGRRETRLIYAPSGGAPEAMEAQAYRFYADAFREGREERFARNYPADISVVTDDRPFFFKYYKFRELVQGFLHYRSHTGTGVFVVQLAILGQCVLFIGAFIFLPLYMFKREGISGRFSRLRVPLVVYFACLGSGFILIEIALMQKFVLILESPIYSLSVTLAALLLFSGVGSFLLPRAKEVLGAMRLIRFLSLGVAGYLVLFVLFGPRILEWSVALPFWARVCVTVLALLPVGLGLGMFYPAGLAVVGALGREAVAWAQGVNSGFTVLGSVLAILLAQFSGFSVCLLCAGVFYLIASVFFRRLEAASQT